MTPNKESGVKRKSFGGQNEKWIVNNFESKPLWESEKEESVMVEGGLTP